MVPPLVVPTFNCRAGAHDHSCAQLFMLSLMAHLVLLELELELVLPFSLHPSISLPLSLSICLSLRDNVYLSFTLTHSLTLHITQLPLQLPLLRPLPHSLSPYPIPCRSTSSFTSPFPPLRGSTVHGCLQHHGDTISHRIPSMRCTLMFLHVSGNARAMAT